MSKRAGDIISIMCILLGLLCLALWVVLRLHENAITPSVPAWQSALSGAVLLAQSMGGIGL